MDEYVAMFGLTESDLACRILGCADGPASFNAEMTARGGSVTSIDPIYRSSADEIRGRIDATYQVVMEQLRANLADYVWTRIGSPEELGALRMASMERFLDDFAQVGNRSRYVDGSLPSLPFGDATFDLALCSHFLFLYSDQLSEDFHVRAIEEMARVAGEVRVYPLLALGNRESEHVDAVCRNCEARGLLTELGPTEYEFQRGANAMLRVWRPATRRPSSSL